MKLPKIKDLVKDNRKARFIFYRDAELWYKTEDGFEFPVPIADIGNATFLAEDKAILLMRYIRKQLDSLQKQQHMIQDAKEKAAAGG